MYILFKKWCTQDFTHNIFSSAHFFSYFLNINHLFISWAFIACRKYQHIYYERTDTARKVYLKKTSLDTALFKRVIAILVNIHIRIFGVGSNPVCTKMFSR